MEKVGIEGLANACREPYWNERSIEDKMELLKSCVQELQRVLKSVELKTETLDIHCHGEDGRILVDLQRVMGRERPEGYSYNFRRLLSEKESEPKR